jgi:hypothetical protein
MRIRSEIPLGGSPCAEDSPDLTVRWATGAIPDRPQPDERVLASFVWNDGQGYTHTQAGTGYILRFHGLCAVRVDATRRSLDVHLSADGDAAMVPLLVGGNALAFVLTLAGECVLHASAVQPNGSALAFVGAAGMGKSTLAALLCANGATLITDDSLRLSPDETGFRCCLGSAEIRLRSNAAELATRFSGAATAPTPDGRVAVRLDEDHRQMPRLGAVVIPRPVRTRTTLAVRRLAPTEAFLALSRYPRIAGIRAPELLSAQFRAFAQVARSVPIYEAEIPWGPPFAPALAEQLVEAVT